MNHPFRWLLIVVILVVGGPAFISVSPTITVIALGLAALIVVCIFIQVTHWMLFGERRDARAQQEWAEAYLRQQNQPPGAQ